MSATLTYEPYQLPAGLLALAVHAVFFGLLYFGFSWQTQPARTMSVELWQSLPEEEIAPPVAPRIAEVIQPVQPKQPVRPAQPEKLIKPDIALPDKKDKKKVEPKPTRQIQEEQKLEKAIERERIEAEQTAQQAAQVEREKAEQAAREKAAQDAAIDAMVNDYTAKIMAKIRHYIVITFDVRDDARAEFRVTLLPDGSVLWPPKLIKSSGNAAYDSAVERAILKSQPLPLPPPDKQLFNRFRVLNLVFKPTE